MALREDSYYAFEHSDFSYAISSGTIASLTITEMPASGTLTKGGRPINNLPDTIPTTGSQRRTLLYRPPHRRARNALHELQVQGQRRNHRTHDGRSTSRPVNDRAYGKVFISGATPRLGMT